MTPIPYGFLPLAPEQAVHDAPLWRDGSSSESRISGELLLTLEALTPLIVGNHQHKVDDKRSVLVPQMLDDGRVLISATSLKGMLRAAISGLLQAPMAQVAEHHYSYRPNLGASGKKREVRPAVVLDSSDTRGGLKVALLDSTSDVVFVKTPVWKALKEPAVGTTLNRVCSGLKYDDDMKAKFRKSLVAAYVVQEGGIKQQDREAKVTLNHTVLHYAGGIDGQGLLAKAFDETKKTYRYVLFPTDKLERARRNPVTVPVSVVRHYEKTQEILADDLIGHLAPGHPDAKTINKQAVQSAIKEHTELRPQQLIYVEYDPTAKQITSFGHHYHYRWAYTSNTLKRAEKIRREIDWLSVERKDEAGQPERLAASRLLFGYALEGGDAPLATGNFKRLAGRLAFNTAIEDIAGKTEAQRFIDGGGEIQLHVLGMPRPSAVEFYLKQTKLPWTLVTYGDLPSDHGGDLAGRKFYRHQPDARTNRSLFAPGVGNKKANTKDEERGTLVRYLSAPGSRFLCTLRFDSLRPWELGALLVALDPALIEPLFGMKRHAEGYAHKLGYGKPLGLGSVRLTLDAARWHENDSWRWQQARRDESGWNELVSSSLNAFKAKLEMHMGEGARQHCETWCAARRWAERGHADYPKAPDKKGEETIYNFHTGMRRRHADVRRGKPGDFNDLYKLLKSAESQQS